MAETGSIVLVTNEGNGRLATSLPRVHVVVLGMERLVADWAQLDLMVNLLARSASGQPLSSYTSITTGPRRTGEADGPDELHVVILDNGRSDLLAGEYHEMLGCIRCGACLNVCPVFRQTGGHAYGWVYSGPMGAVLSPLLTHGADDLSGASTLCGACMDACPVQIPLQDLLLALRRDRAARRGRGAGGLGGVGDGLVVASGLPGVDRRREVGCRPVPAGPPLVSGPHPLEARPPPLPHPLESRRGVTRLDRADTDTAGPATPGDLAVLGNRIRRGHDGTRLRVLRNGVRGGT